MERVALIGIGCRLFSLVLHLAKRLPCTPRDGNPCPVEI